MPLANLDGADIHYRMVGSGTPLLMLLPQSSGPTGRDATIAGLAQRYAVIVYDQRGTGRSSPVSAVASMSEQAVDAFGLLDALQFQRAHLFCHSTGCGIGLSMASREPERILSLVLANPWSHADWHLTVMQRLRIAAARGLDPEQYAHFNAALLFPPEFRHANTAGFAQLAAKAPVSPHDADVIERRLEAILAFDARALLPAIKQPTLVLTARDDQLMPSWYGIEIAQALRDATLIEFDGGGHMLPETRSGALVDAVLAHLARLSHQVAG